MPDSFPAGMLSDTGIRKFFKKGINIYTDEKDGSSFDLERQLHIGSVDLHFRHLFYRFSLEKGATLTYEMLREHTYTKPEELTAQEKLRLNPGEIILTTTLEIVHLSEEFAALITGRSSIARLGIMVHCCQEFIHPGHGQAIPLQLINLSPYPVELDLRVPVCQIVFFKLSSAACEKYVDREDAKYSKEKDPLQSQIFQDVKETKDESMRDPKVDSGTSVNVNVNLGESKEKTQEKESVQKRVPIVKSFLNKYIVPFIPGIIMLLVLTPFLNEYIVNKDMNEIHLSFISVVSNLPAPFVVSVILLILFVIAKRGGE